MSSELSEMKPSRPTGASELSTESWGWFLALGIAMVVVGAMAVILPGVAGLGLALMLGWLLLIGGIIQGIHAFYARAWGGFFMEAMLAVLYAMVGAMLLADPLRGLLMLTVILAVFLALEGVFRIAMAWRVRPMANWGWIMLSGFVSLALAAVIWANLPGDALWVLGLLVGINMIFSGSAMAMFGWAIRAESGRISRDWASNSPA